MSSFLIESIAPWQGRYNELALPPLFEVGQIFDGYLIKRELHANSRSHVYLAQECEKGTSVVLKIPSIEMRDNPAYLERFVMEEWIARRINNAHVIKAVSQTKARQYLYTVTEFIEGTTLAQWLRDHPNPELETVRSIIEQIAKGLYAIHRLEILHQDLRPENIMIDHQGTVKIIDFGSAYVAGIAESQTTPVQEALPGTALFMAPEYFIGANCVATVRSVFISCYCLFYAQWPVPLRHAYRQSPHGGNAKAFELPVSVG